MRKKIMIGQTTEERAFIRRITSIPNLSREEEESLVRTIKHDPGASEKEIQAAKDASDAELQIKSCNSGVILTNSKNLMQLVKLLNNNNTSSGNNSMLSVSSYNDDNYTSNVNRNTRNKVFELQRLKINLNPKDVPNIMYFFL